MEEKLAQRYEERGDTLSGTTSANKPYEVGVEKGLSRGRYARYATVMNAPNSTGYLYFGREHQLGAHYLIPGQGYTFDYVDVFGIILQDNGTACTWTIDYTGP
jgi:hypothetical protein